MLMADDELDAVHVSEGTDPLIARDTIDRRDQEVAEHGAGEFNNGVTYTKYMNGMVFSLQDQADNGGSHPQSMPINGDIHPLASKMGTRGSYVDANNHDVDDY
jgi:hypothetical protein